MRKLSSLFKKRDNSEEVVLVDSSIENIAPHIPSQRTATAEKSEGNYVKTEPLKDSSQGEEEDNYDASRYIVDVTDVSWDDVAGMQSVKSDLQEVVVLLQPDEEVQKAIEHFNLDPLKGMLMYGPPGCGKTLVAKALAAQCNATFYLIDGPEIKSKWIGESAKILRSVYKDAQKNKPAIIFIDEIDAIAMSRDSPNISETTRDLVNTLLTLLNGIKDINGIFTIGATNCPRLLDSALIRSGRLGKGVHVRLPDEEGRKQILEKKFSKIPLSSEITIAELVERTNNYSGADIASMADDSARLAWRRNGYKADGEVSREDIDEALKKGTSVSWECITDYERWEKDAFQ